MTKPFAPRIDVDQCSGCGRCVPVCPSKSLAVEEGTARIVNGECIGCGHCEAVCPERAVSLDAADGWAEAFETFSSAETWLAPGAVDPGELVRLMRSRRSVRNYSQKPVSRATLEDLVRVAVTAPSGTNSQKWTFTIFPDRKAVMTLGEGVAGFFRRLNRTAENAFIRFLCRITGKKELLWYYQEYYPSVKEALREWDKDKVDRLFHGAPAVIAVGSAPGASCPSEDALLASQNILLAAHSLGLGTCLVGYAVEAMRHDRRIARLAGIPEDEAVHAVIALGYPKERYAKTARRFRPVVRYFET